MNIYCKNLANKSRQLNLILLNETNNRFLSTICTRFTLFNWKCCNSTVDVNNYRFNSIAASQNRNLTKKSSRNNNGSIYSSKNNSKKKQEESIKKEDIKYSPLFKPIDVKPNTIYDEDDIGASMVGKLEKCKYSQDFLRI